MRRFEKAADETAARKILETASYGFLALAAADYPYGVPLNFALCGNAIYFHAAREGKKTDLLRANPRAMFCAVSKDEVLQDKFTTLFESAMAFGKITEVEDTDERIRALKLLTDKYSPKFPHEADAYIARAHAKPAVLRFDIEILTGKINAQRP